MACSLAAQFTSSSQCPLPVQQYTSVKRYLPPCRVCGGKASGLYYCVNTCNGCRMFFRRMLQNTSPPACLNNNTCVIDHRTVRRACPACRYQKCLDAGMRVNEKRVGRYSHALQTCYTEELQHLELRLQVNSGNLLTAEERNTELDLLSERLTGVFVNKHHNRPDYIARALVLGKRHHRICQLEDELMGPLSPLTFEEYQQIYTTTGLDVDCRRQHISKAFSFIELSSREMYKFIECITGYKKLPVKDQFALCKASIPANDIVNAYHMYDPQQQTLVLAYHARRIQDMAIYHSQEVLQLLTKCYLELQSLDLTLEERASLNAYVIFHADASLSAEGRRVLDPIADTISDLLIRTIQRSHDDYNEFFSRLVSVLLLMEEASQLMLREYEACYNRYEDLPWPYPAKVVFGFDSVNQMVDEFQNYCKIMETENEVTSEM